MTAPLLRRSNQNPGWICEATDLNADLCDLHQANPQRYPALFESVATGTDQSRYSILFAFPGESMVARQGSATGRANVSSGQFLSRLDQGWYSSRLGGAPPPLPFSGGWLLYLGYELAAAIEHSVAPTPGSENLVQALALRIPAAIVRDHRDGQTWLVSEADDSSRIAAMRADLEHPAAPVGEEVSEGGWHEEDPERFVRGVERIQRYIREGDVFQVNLSRRWRSATAKPVDPVALYRRLRRSNPAPFAGIWQFDTRHAIVSSSPERLVEVRDRQVRTRPIAGTYPRGNDDATDQRLATELLAHPKERAEHVMLIDLERNDLGRICKPGSVRVDEFMVVETYRHVHHIVSQVTGTLREEATPAAVIRATFPGGTITGCPKVRCMQIISELERAPRGPYTGSMGYLNHDGSMDLNILIRTMLVDGNEVSLRAGAGIVADSVPERELEETRAKARGMLRALGQDADHA